MTRFTSNPIILNNLIRLSTSDIRVLHLLVDGGCYWKEINWKSNNLIDKNTTIATILVKLSDHSADPHLELSYQYMGQEYSYSVIIEKVKSNIGRGEVSFFKCPHCDRRCRKLFFFQGYFVCRHSIDNSFYECQICCKQSRQIVKISNSVKKYNSAIKDLQNENYRFSYNGIITKRHLNNLNNINNLNHFA